ncbi:MAG: tRNA lysidine(34) synthetase TilS [Oscillospiraceae bacterium]
MARNEARELTSQIEAKFRLLLPDEPCTVLCALSGGLDSMCLLDLLCRWGEVHPVTVVAAHYHHGLRGEFADRDENFVRNYCAGRGIPVYCEQGDTRATARGAGLSIEEAARQLRYAFLSRTAQAVGAAVICTAHHADDNAETLLLNLCRGTGLPGLCGIPPERDGICRPLLELTREELERYAAARELPHVEDETNGEDEAARNLIRHRILPVLREINPRAIENMTRTAGLCQQENAALEQEAERLAAPAQASPGRIFLARAAFSAAPAALRPRMVLCLLTRLPAGRRDVGCVHIQRVVQLALTGGGTEEIHLPHGVTARNAGDRLVLETVAEKIPEKLLRPGDTVVWGDYTLTCGAAKPPASPNGGIALRWDGETPVVVGAWRPGDRLTLAGARGSRSVKRLFTDRGILPGQRAALPAFYQADHLSAIWRLGIDVAALPREGAPLLWIQVDGSERQKSTNTEEKET